MWGSHSGVFEGSLLPGVVLGVSKVLRFFETSGTAQDTVNIPFILDWSSCSGQRGGWCGRWRMCLEFGSARVECGLTWDISWPISLPVGECLVISWNRPRSLQVLRVIKSNRLRWAGHVAGVRGCGEVTCRKETLGTPRLIWEDNIKMDLKECWIHVAKNRDEWRAVVNAVMDIKYECS
jgi:hypothetical protein